MAVIEVINSKKGMVVTIIDIDNFKDVNDIYGHQAGDNLLKIIAKTIRSNLRPKDIIGRYGGDEFIIALPNTSVKNGLEIINRIKESIEDLEIPFMKSFINVSASFGMTTYNELSIMTVDEVIYCADVALRTAKNIGKNKVVNFETMQSNNKLKGCEYNV